MRYKLYYWPTIQGRGEFIRLALEQSGATYTDVARRSERSGMGVAAMLRLMENGVNPLPSFAPPFLQSGDIFIGQTANILLFLGPRLHLVPEDEAMRLWAHQLQLTIADLVKRTTRPISAPVTCGEESSSIVGFFAGVAELTYT